MSQLPTSTAPLAQLDPLFAAALRGDVAAARARLRDDPAAVRALDDIGATPLHWSARYEHPGLLSLLLESGAALEARDRLHDSTPLAWAAYYGCSQIVELLLRAGARRDAVNRYQLTPIEIAEGGQRGEHAADCPHRGPQDFLAIIEVLRSP